MHKFNVNFWLAGGNMAKYGGQLHLLTPQNRWTKQILRWTFSHFYLELIKVIIKFASTKN